MNVLLLCVNDLRPQFGTYGTWHRMKTPNVDKLASEGVLFERAYCQYPICGPSRASFLEWSPTDSRPVHRVELPDRQGLPGALTFPEHFRTMVT